MVIAARERSRGSVRLPDGWTIAQLALVHGLKTNTVYARWLRGWPVERLGDPIGRREGLGSTKYVPERRRTHIRRKA